MSEEAAGIIGPPRLIARPPPAETVRCEIPRTRLSNGVRKNVVFCGRTVVEQSQLSLLRLPLEEWKVLPAAKGEHRESEVACGARGGC